MQAGDLRKCRNGALVQVAGRILMRQRPGTAHGTVFVTIEDETGPVNLIVWASVFEAYRRVLLSAKVLMVYGNCQIEKGVVHLVVQRCFNLNFLLERLVTDKEEDQPVLAKERNFR
jgi:error-prone DNA polymerase